MSTTSLCPQCGAALPPNAPAGLCPRCLMAMNVATQTALPDDPAGAAAQGAKPVARPEELAGFFPQLEIMGCLGRGGMGVVYKARQKSLNRLVALKILAPERERDAAFAQRFALEAETLAKLDHPNIVAVHDFGEAGGLFYLVMEFVDGVNLHRLLDGHRVAPREALAIVPQICDALQFAHDRGIVHRDIKPENILLDRRFRVKVADFGLAKLVGTAAGAPVPGAATPRPASLTEAGRILGTPQYMAPEQLRDPAEVDHRADIYALGVVLYQMLTGELPDKKLEPPSHKVRIDVRLDEVVLRALEKEPGRRYTQASVLKTELETIAADQAPEEGGVPPAAGVPLTASARLEHELGLGSGTLRVVRRLACVLGTIWGVGFLLFILRDGFPLVPYSPPRVASGVEAGFLGLLLAGLAAGWWRDGLAAGLTLTGWSLFFFSERQPLPQLWLYAPVVIGVMYLWSWLLRRVPLVPRVPGKAAGTDAAGTVAELVAPFARRLMWLGILGMGATLLVQCRGVGEGSVVFGPLVGQVFWRLPVPAGWERQALIAYNLLPALYLLLVIGAWHMRQMRTYPLALASTVLAMLLPPLFPVSLPLGLWTWFVLTRPELRQEFSRVERNWLADLQRGTPRFSRLALAGALVGILPGLAMATTLAMAPDLISTTSASAPWTTWQRAVAMPLLLLVSWSSPLAAVVLAWAAWEELRRSQGRLRGAGLIAFAVLLPFLGKVLWWLRGETFGAANWPASLLANVARSQLVLLASAGIALWLHRLEASRSRSPQQHRAWWLFAPSLRWVIAGLALFCLLGFPPRSARAKAAQPAITTNAPSQAGPPTNSVPAAPVRTP